YMYHACSSAFTSAGNRYLPITHFQFNITKIPFPCAVNERRGMMTCDHTQYHTSTQYRTSHTIPYINTILHTIHQHTIPHTTHNTIHQHTIPHTIHNTIHQHTTHNTAHH